MSAYDILASSFSSKPGQLVRPGDTSYAEELGVYWHVGNQEIKPQVIFRPKTSTEAAQAVKTLADNNVEFAIRSGGAMPNTGFNTSSKAVIATKDLNSEITFPREGIASVGPGVTWEKVYEVLLEKELTAVGARSDVMALGGSILGGGLSHFSSQHGWASDNVVNFEIVLGSGAIVNANENENHDLFWALKGGLNNFGLVTRFDIKVIPQAGGIWGGMLTINPANVDQLLNTFYDFELNQELNDPLGAAECIMFRGSAFGGMSTTIPVMLMAYAKPIESPESFRVFHELPSIASTMRKCTHLDLIRELSTGITKDKRHMFYAGTYRADPEINKAAHDIFFDTLNEADIPDITLCAFTLQSVSPHLLSHGEGKNPFPLKASEAPYIMWNMAVEYLDSACDERVNDTLRKAKERIEAVSKAKNRHVDFLFLNNAGPDQVPYKAWGDGTLSRLKQVRDKYDPGLVFTKLCSGGWKLD